MVRPSNGYWQVGRDSLAVRRRIREGIVSHHQADFDVRRRVATNLERLRGNANLTTRALAGRSGVSQNTVNRIQELETAVTADVLARLAFALCVDVSEFFMQYKNTGES